MRSSREELDMSKRCALWRTDVRGIISVARYVKLDEAVRLVDEGKAEPVLHRQTGATIALHLRQDVRKASILSKPAFVPMAALLPELPLKVSCTAFSKAEVEAIVGLRGKSKTAHLSEEQKAERIRQRWSAEDIVESAQQKLAVYPTVR